MSAALADRVGAYAAGALVAQKFVDDLRHERAVPAEAPEVLRSLTISWGSDSPAINGFLVEIAKRCR